RQPLRVRRAEPPFWSASVPSVSARCSVQNWPIGRTPVDAPAGRTVRVCSVRLVSFSHRPVAAICYEVEPVDGPARITVQSELTANEQLPPAGADPRVAAALEDPLRGEYHDATGTAVVLVHKTRRSGMRVGAAMDHLVDCPVRGRRPGHRRDGAGAGPEAAGDQVRGLKSLGTQAPGFGGCLRARPRHRARAPLDPRAGNAFTSTWRECRQEHT